MLLESAVISKQYFKGELDIRVRTLYGPTFNFRTVNNICKTTEYFNIFSPYEIAKEKTRLLYQHLGRGTEVVGISIFKLTSKISIIFGG